MPRPVPDDAHTCEVPGCQRWSRLPGRFICGTHWRRLTKAERRVWSRLRRTINRIGVGWHTDAALYHRYLRAWPALVRRAGQ